MTSGSTIGDGKSGLGDASTGAIGVSSRPTSPTIIVSRDQVVLATLLTALAGFLDAVGYAELDHLYLSFMSGNSTHLGMSLAMADWTDASGTGVIIAAFVAGAALGALVADGCGRLLLVNVLVGEFLIFLVAISLAYGGHDRVALGLVAAAMGMQNTLHQVIAGADVGKGFITGALFGLGQSLARFKRGDGQLTRAAQNALSWLAFIGGIVAGTLVLGAIGLTGSLTAVTAVLASAVFVIYVGWL